jgi:ankyrin repeat protein
MAKLTDRYSNENLINLATKNYDKTKKSTLPTEVVTLASGGKVYPKTNPLSSGKVEMRYMTAYDEDILTNASYIKEGIVLDKLLEALIISDININDIASVDKDGLLIHARIVSYGKMYPVIVVNPKTGKSLEREVDLSKISAIDFQLESDENGEFDYIINEDLTLKFQYAAITGEQTVSEALQKAITQVNKSRSAEEIKHFIQYEFLAVDAKKFRSYIADNAPAMNYEYEFEGEEGGTFKARFQPGTDLFWF